MFTLRFHISQCHGPGSLGTRSLSALTVASSITMGRKDAKSRLEISQWAEEGRLIAAP